MEAFTLAFLSLFAVYGIISMIDSIVDGIYQKRRGTDRVLIYVKSTEERIEGLIRHLVYKNPNAEIIIANDEDRQEIREILDKLTKEYASVSIGRM
ncbi:MAG: hypothetical protein Q4B31_01215 [Clostridia bacterium]|nr:hypothetical protein [Clostridia bacterium]